MKKDDALQVLQMLKEIKKETEIIESREKEKYNVGLLLKESIEGLRICIATFQQRQMREDTRQQKLNYLRDIGLNLLDVCRILVIGDGSPPQPKEFVSEGKRDPLRRVLEKRRKVLKEQKKIDSEGGSG